MNYTHASDRIKKNVRAIVLRAVVIVGFGAAVYDKFLEPYIEQHFLTKSISTSVLLSIVGVIIFCMMYFLTDLYIALAESLLNWNKELSGWWIYGFKVKDSPTSPERIVIGRFFLIHNLSGLSVKDRGQSDYFMNGKFSTRGNWESIETISNEANSDIWIIYDFDKLEDEKVTSYLGLMNLQLTGRLGILKSNRKDNNFKKFLKKIKIYWKRKKYDPKKCYLYDGFLRDLNHYNVTFTRFFAQRIPYRIKNVNEIDEIIKHNYTIISELLN